MNKTSKFDAQKTKLYEVIATERFVGYQVFVVSLVFTLSFELNKLLNYSIVFFLSLNWYTTFKFNYKYKTKFHYSINELFWKKNFQIFIY